MTARGKAGAAIQDAVADRHSRPTPNPSARELPPLVVGDGHVVQQALTPDVDPANAVRCVPGDRAVGDVKVP